MTTLTLPTDMECLLLSLRRILSNLSHRWLNHGEPIDWRQFEDLAYWRFCRFASHTSGRLIQLGASIRDYNEFNSMLQEFVDLVDDMYGEMPKACEAARPHIEKIQRAGLHCKERSSWIQEHIKGLAKFADRTERMLAQLRSQENG